LRELHARLHSKRDLFFLDVHLDMRWRLSTWTHLRRRRVSRRQRPRMPERPHLSEWRLRLQQLRHVQQRQRVLLGLSLLQRRLLAAVLRLTSARPLA
jgi:hypothetical protein